QELPPIRRPGKIAGAARNGSQFVRATIEEREPRGDREREQVTVRREGELERVRRQRREVLLSESIQQSPWAALRRGAEDSPSGRARDGPRVGRPRRSKHVLTRRLRGQSERPGNVSETPIDTARRQSVDAVGSPVDEQPRVRCPLGGGRGRDLPPSA